MIIFMSFCLDFDHVVRFVGVVGQHLRASLKSLSFIEWTKHQVNFHFALTWTFVFIFWNMNLTLKITLSMEFTHSFFLWLQKHRTCLLYNIIWWRKKVCILSSSTKYVNHYDNCLENKSKYDIQTECIYLPLEEWWPT